MRVHDHGLKFALPAREMPLWRLIAEISTSYRELPVNEGAGTGVTVEPQLTDIWFEQNDLGLHRVRCSMWIENDRWEITALAPAGVSVSNPHNCVMIHAELHSSIDTGNPARYMMTLRRFFRATSSVALATVPKAETTPVILPGHGDAPDDYKETINP